MADDLVGTNSMPAGLDKQYGGVMTALPMDWLLLQARANNYLCGLKWV